MLILIIVCVSSDHGSAVKLDRDYSKRHKHSYSLEQNTVSRQAPL